MTPISSCNFYPLGDDKSFIARADQFVVLRERVGCYQVFIFVWRDYSRVFIGGGQYGYDWIAREADTLEIEALAERFGHAELKQVLKQRAGQK